MVACGVAYLLSGTVLELRPELRGVVALDHHVDLDGRCICFGGKPLILVFLIKQWGCLEPLTLMRATFLEQVLAKGVWRAGRCLRR